MKHLIILLILSAPAQASVHITGRITCGMFGQCGIASPLALLRCRVTVENTTERRTANINRFGYYALTFENPPIIDNYHFGYDCQHDAIQYQAQDWQFVDGTENVVNGGVIGQ